jgi:hypothetical protein
MHAPLRLGAAVATAALGTSLLTAGAAAPEAAEAPTIARDVSVDTRRRLVGDSALRAFMASDAPKSITIDVDANQITEISDAADKSERAYAGQVGYVRTATPDKLLTSGATAR